MLLKIGRLPLWFGCGDIMKQYDLVINIANYSSISLLLNYFIAPIQRQETWYDFF